VIIAERQTPIAGQVRCADCRTAAMPVVASADRDFGAIICEQILKPGMESGCGFPDIAS